MDQKTPTDQIFPSRSERLRRNRRPKTKRNHFKHKEWVISIVIAVLLAMIVRLFVVEPSMVTGPSMEPTMQTGDLVLVNKIIYKFRNPKRGEIIVFPTPSQKDYIKRIIALPGETVEARNHRILINGKELNEPYLSNNIRTDDFPATKVPPEHVFVLGDNRINSIDSRSSEIGTIPFDKIRGRADWIYWPFSHMKWIW
ncbi:signal peptidase I [Thermoflavimicrobium dichotomicum]|uniref:Signal peptidase I n=1 Tax=Thermoflavimicrobium dichotomicum TaxID=46223 RepID=A0A1I3U9W1_9BACL|nr:signal peptidase I [Thermoflavimicrobium dichotomicum]SFJ80294.1 signal peptidase I [Thermoflavimicrobium dichotomicum]